MSTARRSFVSLVTGLAMLAGGPTGRIAAGEAQVATERPAGPTIDFVALDADGAPIVDLQSGEVEVRIADRARTIRNLRRVVAGATAGPARLPAPYGTNDDVAAGRLFLI